MCYRLGALLACLLLTFAAGPARAQSYHLERIASGLNQPTYVTQAPGDPPNILYFTERVSVGANPIGGFGTLNEMGKVWRYDVETRSKTLVLDLSSRDVINDDGLQTIAFSPDFNTAGAPTYHKLYVSSAQRNTFPTSIARNRVEEYTMNPDGTFGSPRTILRYNNNKQNNHTIDWIGFDPTAAGSERNYLYISTGDGSFGNSYDGGESPNGRPSQNPNDVRGKILRVDVSPGDAYPADDFKNFVVPSSNPIPAYNAANPGSPISGLGEVWATGVRNGYRMSFDRATGDLYFGDVGEVAIEEIDFLKAGTNASGPPVDFGWPQLEGTQASNIGGAPHTTVNPFTGVTSLNPIQQYSHGSGLAAIGGYLYRGPLAELQGKYFFADFVGTPGGSGGPSRFWMLDFDRNTPPASFNGNNGTVTEVSALWQSRVIDPTDPTYQPSSSPLDLAGLDHIVSFGEDNAGNLYIVDFGNRTLPQDNFNGQYPHAGLGEIFRLTRDAPITLTIDRDTGAITLSNDADAAVGIRSYSISSGAGAIDSSTFTPITGNFDAPPGGDGSIDPNDPWHITSPGMSRALFSEASLGDGGTLAPGQQLDLSLSGGWIPSPFEDLLLSITLGDGSVAGGTVQFVGNGGTPFSRSDLTFDGQLDVSDWSVYASHHLVSLAGLSNAEQYGRGDLDGDGDNDFDDFRVFQSDFDAANGSGALAALLERVPEPSSGLIATIMTFVLCGSRARAAQILSRP